MGRQINCNEVCGQFSFTLTFCCREFDLQMPQLQPQQWWRNEQEVMAVGYTECDRVGQNASHTRQIVKLTIQSGGSLHRPIKQNTYCNHSIMFSQRLQCHEPLKKHLTIVNRTLYWHYRVRGRGAAGRSRSDCLSGAPAAGCTGPVPLQPGTWAPGPAGAPDPETAPDPEGTPAPAGAAALLASAGAQGEYPRLHTNLSKETRKEKA